MFSENFAKDHMVESFLNFYNELDIIVEMR